MQKKLCFGFGVVLFGFAAMLYFGGNADNAPDLRSVGKTEAAMVLGGSIWGSLGYTSAKCGQSGANGCDAFTGKTSIGVGGDLKLDAFHSCGGTCGLVGVGQPSNLGE